MPDSLLSPNHWRKRAEEARTMAADVRDPGARESLLNLARQCDRLAELADEHQSPKLRSSRSLLKC